MSPEQDAVWFTNRAGLIRVLLATDGIERMTFNRYEVRVPLNDTQDIVCFPATVEGAGEYLPVGLVLETFEVKRAGDEPESTKLIGLVWDWSGAISLIAGLFQAHREPVEETCPECKMKDGDHMVTPVRCSRGEV